MTFASSPPQFLFFTGKGGVGKTTLSCATAVRLAGKGARVLLVSTDPASNIDEVFGQKIGDRPTAIDGVPGLFGLNINPELAAVEYRERVVGPYRGVLPEAVTRSIEEQLSGACTVEIAAFDEFAKLLGDENLTSAYEHVIFDTAPTGHTLRLLSLPAAWTSFLADSRGGVSCLGPLQGLIAQRNLYADSARTLCDPARTCLVLVSRPDRAALDEARRSSVELGKLGVRNQELALNGVFRAADRHDPIAAAFERRGTEAIEAMPRELARLPRTEVALRGRQLLGAESLATLFDPVAANGVTGVAASPPPGAHDFSKLVDAISANGQGVIMVMGKGGVGKTTVAVKVAAELGRRGHRVSLSTTDPAGHVVEAAAGLPANVSVGRIDPTVEVARYRREVLETTGRGLNADARALLEEDLASPCTEEIAVFQAFAAVVDAAKDSFVVLDTAPTGHSLLLLDAAQSFSRELSRQSGSKSEPVTNLLPRLRDPAFTRVLLCTLAEATPVHEAAALQRDLRRAGIEPYAWIVTQSLVPNSVSDPLLVSRRNQELRYLGEVAGEHTKIHCVLPFVAPAEAGHLVKHEKKPVHA